MNKNIKPFTSLKSRKNVYDYYNDQTNTTSKVAGFDIYLYDATRGIRIRKRIKVDFQTASLIVGKMKIAIQQNSPMEVDRLSGSRAKTLADLHSAFCTNKRRNANRVGNGISEQTLKRYSVALKSMIKSNNRDLGRLSIGRVTTDWIERRLHERVKKGLSLKTLNTDLTHLKSIFKWGIDHRYLDSNPFEKIPKFKVKPSKPRILSMEEWDLIWSIAKTSRWRPLILTYLLTGARLSEILKHKLSWNNINFTKCSITLDQRKRGKSLTLPMPKLLKDELLWLKDHKLEKETCIREDDGEYPFPFHKDYISHVVKRDIFIPAGVTDISIHDLRRTFASYLIHLGIPVAVVSQLMSHSTTRITEQVYIGQLDSIQREALDGLAEFILPNESNNPENE